MSTTDILLRRFLASKDLNTCSSSHSDKGPLKQSLLHMKNHKSTVHCSKLSHEFVLCLNDQRQHVQNDVKPDVKHPGNSLEIANNTNPNAKIIDSEECKHNQEKINHPNRRTSKICRKGTPYPHIPAVTVEQSIIESSSDSQCSSRENEVTENDNSSVSVDDLDLDTVTVISCTDNISCLASLSDFNPLYPTSRSFEDLSNLESGTPLLHGRNWVHHNCKPTAEELYQYHLYESIMYGDGKITPGNVPRIPSPPPLPTRPPNLLPPCHLSSVIDAHKFYRAKYYPNSVTNITGRETTQLLKQNLQFIPRFRQNLHSSSLQTDISQTEMFGFPHQCDEGICADPNCLQVCSICAAIEKELVSKLNKANGCQALENKKQCETAITKGKTINSNNIRITKLQKIGAVLRKNFLPHEKSVANDHITTPCQQATVNMKDKKFIFVAPTGSSAPSQSLSKLSDSCEVPHCDFTNCNECHEEECCSSECCSQPRVETCTELACCKSKLTQSEVLDQIANVRTLNGVKSNETTEALLISSNDIPTKAKITLGIIDPPNMVIKLAGKKSNNSVINKIEIFNRKIGKTIETDNSKRKYKFSNPHLLKNTSKHLSLFKESNGSHESRMSSITVKCEVPDVASKSSDISSNNSCNSTPPPTPPPHAAILRFGGASDNEEDDRLMKEPKTDARVVPQPPPRTTSVPCLPLFREDNANLPPLLDSNAWHRYNLTTTSANRRPLPPLPSNFLESLPTVNPTANPQVSVPSTSTSVFQTCGLMPIQEVSNIRNGSDEKYNFNKCPTPRANICQLNIASRQSFNEPVPIDVLRNQKPPLAERNAHSKNKASFGNFSDKNISCYCCCCLAANFCQDSSCSGVNNMHNTKVSCTNSFHNTNSTVPSDVVLHNCEKKTSKSSEMTAVSPPPTGPKPVVRTLLLQPTAAPSCGRCDTSGDAADNRATGALIQPVDDEYGFNVPSDHI